jgi:uncharacterized protein
MITIMCGNSLVGGAISIASTFGSRFMGLMFRKRLPEGSGLLLLPCSSVHMCFMRMALDIVYMDAGLRVLGVQQGLKPWRVGTIIKGVKQVLELPAGTARRCGIVTGIVLKVEQLAQAGGIQIAEEKRDIHGLETN